MNIPTLPVPIARAVTARWPRLGPAWVRAVEAELRDLCARYAATPVQAFPSRYGYVVECAAGRAALVMRATPDPHGALQAESASALARLGLAPRLQEHLTTGTGHWTVMERIMPGQPLRGIEATHAVLRALATVFRTLAEAPPPGGTGPGIDTWLRQRLLDDNLTELPPGASPAPPGERRAALAVLDDLTRHAPRTHCHGDASPGNILTAPGGRLMLVDPRGLRGEAAYDIAVAALKLKGPLRPERAADLLAESAGTEPERVRAWMTVALAARV